MMQLRKISDTRTGRRYIQDIVDTVYAPHTLYQRHVTPWELPDRPWFHYKFVPFPWIAKIEWRVELRIMRMRARWRRLRYR